MMIQSVANRLIRALVWSRVAWIALRSYRNPRRALVAVRGIAAAGASRQRWATQKYTHASGRYFLSMFAPGWPSPAFDRFAARELDRIVPFRNAPAGLQTAIFAVTKRCALKCAHCVEWDVLNKHEAMSRDDLHAVAARLREVGAGQVMLTGGEPLRRFADVESLTRALAPHSDVWILSSGHGLTVDRAKTLRAAGLTGVALSLDHWDAAEHDRFRGFPGAFEWVERGAANAQQAGLVVAVSLCPTRHFISAENLERYARVAQRIGANFIQLLEPKAVGRYAGQDVVLTADQQRELELFCSRLNLDPAYRLFPPVSYADHARRTNGCTGAGDRYMYVDTDGAVHPCPFCRKPAGNALDGDLETTLGVLRAAGCQAERAGV